jgi:hypothetical protein
MDDPLAAVLARSGEHVQRAADVDVPVKLFGVLDVAERRCQVVNAVATGRGAHDVRLLGQLAHERLDAGFREAAGGFARPDQRPNRAT